MMTAEGFPRGKAAVVAAATHGIGEMPGFTSMELAVSASVKALNAIGLTPRDVDGLFIGLPGEFLSGLALADYLGTGPR